MTEAPPRAPRDREKWTVARVALWLLVASVGGFLFITGIIGILVKAR
jgi:hypothetical protein